MVTLFTDVTKIDERSRRFICVRFAGRLGNNIFQFASAFGISRSNGYLLFISKTSSRIFKINITQTSFEKYCNKLPVVKEYNKRFATFNPFMMKLNSTGNIRVGAYLQS